MSYDEGKIVTSIHRQLPVFLIPIIDATIQI